MQNKGCITCKKCEQVRINFYCGRKRLSQKQLYNKHGFCSDYEPKEHNGKPMTEQEYIQTCNTEQLAEVISYLVFGGDFKKHISKMGYINMHSLKTEIVEWLKQPHKPIS